MHCIGSRTGAGAAKPPTPFPERSVGRTTPGASNPVRPAVRSPPMSSASQVAVKNGPTNSLGVAGFVVSLTGLIATCGVLSPIGMLLSFFALFRKPRGFAFAGLVLGIVGSFWILLIGLLGLVAAGGAAVGIHAANQHMEYARDYEAITASVEQYKSQAGFVPASLLELSNVNDDQLKDQWGNYYNYTVGADGQSFTLKSDGPDGAADTEDDFELPQGQMFDHIGPDNFDQVLESLKQHHGGRHHEEAAPPAKPAKRTSTPI